MVNKTERKKSNFTSSGYQGYKVSVHLIRESIDEYDPVSLEGPTDVYEFMKDIEDFDREVFYSIHLDTKNKVIACEEVSKGSSSSAVVRPAEVYRSALLSSAESLIFVHNHPSGSPDPSKYDLQMIDRLVDCGHLLGISVLDSVVIGKDSFYSFSDEGQLKPPHKR